MLCLFVFSCALYDCHIRDKSLLVGHSPDSEDTVYRLSHSSMFSFCFFQVPLTKESLKSLKTDIPIDVRGRPLRQARHTLSRAAYNRSSDTKVSRMELDQYTSGSPHTNGRPSVVKESTSYLFRAGTSTGTSDSRASLFARKLRCVSKTKNAFQLGGKTFVPDGVSTSNFQTA